MQPGSRLARLGALTQLVFAALIDGVSGLAGDPEPDFVSRPVVLLAIFALPGLVGLLAVARHRPGAVLAAGIASAVGSFVAFSGITLIFLVPASLMLIGAARVPAEPGEWRSRAVGAARGFLIAILMVGAGGSALLITDARCWTWRETPSGVVMEPAPLSTGEVEVPLGSTGSGCANGLISQRGVGLGLALGLATIGIAALPVRRRGAPD